MTEPREISEARIYHATGKLSLIHERDKTGQHRLRATDRNYQHNTDNRHPIGDWVPVKLLRSVRLVA